MALKLFYVLLIWLLAENSYSLSLDSYTRSTWREVKTENFHVITDSGEKRAKALVRDLERFRYFLTSVAPYPSLEGVPPVKILAVRKPVVFNRLGLNDSVGGLFTKTSDGSYAIANVIDYKPRSDAFSYGRSILFHEYVHYFMSNTFDPLFYPRWYNEGIAEYYASFIYDKGVASLGGLGILKYRLWEITNESGVEAFDLRELFHATGKVIDITKRKTSKVAKQHELRFYAKSVAVMHYIYASENRKNQLDNYLQAINLGQDIDLAFENSFSMTYKEMEEGIRQYLSGEHMKRWRFKLNEADAQYPSLVVRKLSKESVYFHLFDIFMRFPAEDYQHKKLLLQQAQEKYPSHLGLKALTALYVHGVDSEAGLSLLEEILKYSPKHHYALGLMGDAKLIEANRYRVVDHKDTIAKFKEARSFYRKAIQLNPFNGRANFGVGQIYYYMPRDLPINKSDISEGIAAYDNASFLVSFSQLRQVNSNQAMLRLYSGDVSGALKPLASFNRSVENLWAKEYNEFFLEVMTVDSISKKELSKDGDAFVFPDGSRYLGAVKNRLPNGGGRLLRINGTEVKGHWYEGSLVGDVNFESSNGFVYLGEFKNGMPNGNGRLLAPADSPFKEFVGQFFNGLKHGEFEIAYRGDIVEKGNFWFGSRHGIMILTDSQGREEQHEYVYGERRISLEGEEVFVGTVNSEGKPEGEGTCFLASVNPEPYACSF